MFKVLAFVLLLFYTTSANAITKLLMYHSKYCSHCIAFVKEVAIDYHYDLPDKFMEDTLELVIIERNEEPFWFAMAYNENRIKPIRGTPTFIIWNGRKELARLVGYSNKESFYNRLDTIFQK
tara:strand:- start:46 stop:411 length:366 start_codon:yes stop_codon:yes gene_type:complete